MEDLLPLYANMVHKFCPCEEEKFKESCFRVLSKAIFHNAKYEKLPESNQKTIQNHLTEIAGALLGLYYPSYDKESEKYYVNESESCKNFIEKNDSTAFFKNLCLNFQFPNGAKKIQTAQEDIKRGIRIKPFCYVVGLLYYAQQQKGRELLTKQEMGYYVLNNLDVLQGGTPYDKVYERIMSDRKNKVKREKLTGSRDWQHIKEQFNLLELANIVETDATYIWLNKDEAATIECFLQHKDDFIFDAYKYDLGGKEGQNLYVRDWKEAYGRFNSSLPNVGVTFAGGIDILDKSAQTAHPGATKSTVDLGDAGEALVFSLEKERVRAYKDRLVNKVLLLGKTKGLGYDISSVEADENPAYPEFARYIEVKSTKRVTEPNFATDGWTDSLNITAKEWTAAMQYREYYNIYRVYFTRTGTRIIRINNPFKKAEDGDIEVYPTVYQMDFDAKVIERRYEE